MNKNIQAQYWKLSKEKGFKKYHVIAGTDGAEPIVEHTLVSEADFDDMNKLTRQIEQKVLKFASDVEQLRESTILIQETKQCLPAL